MLTQKGFSIAQVVVAMSIMSVVSLGITSMLQNQTNTVFYLEDKMSHQNFKKEVENLLSDSAACTESLTNINVPASILPNATQLFNIKDSTGAVVFDAANNNRNKFDKLEISNISIQNVDIVGAAVAGKVNIKVDVRRQRGPANTNQALQSVVIQKDVVIDGTRAVTSCTGGGNDPSNACLENSGGRNWGGRTGPAVVRVPTDAKAMIVYINGSQCSGNGGGGVGNRWSGSVNSLAVPIHLNGKNSTWNGRPMVSGGTLRTRSLNGSTEILYDSTPIARTERCDENSSNHTQLFGSNTVSTCHKTTDFRPAISNQRNGFNVNGTEFSVSYWK